MSEMRDLPKVVCLTPVKNEAWILDRFIQCASLWADHIIIADQQSDDGSREIAQKYSKVTLIENLSSTFNEPERQKILIDEARKISGPLVLLALDADEFLTANMLASPEWKTVLESDPGTVIQLQWVNLLPDIRHCWIPKQARAFGFVDDGNSKHKGKKIHSPRLPTPEISSRLTLKEIKVIHYQYTDWLRMQSKHRWYQMWEIINDPNKSAISVYRQYHHMYATTGQEFSLAEDKWFKKYIDSGIDMTSTYQPTSYWWDAEAIALLEKYTPQYFRSLDIWNFSWLVEETNNCLIKDPRSGLERLLHSWLKKSQFAFHENFEKDGKKIFQITKRITLIIDKILIFLGW